MNTMKRLIFILALFSVIGTICLPAAASQEGRMGEDRRFERFERVQGRIMEVRNERLKQALNLDDRTAGRVFPVIERHDRRKAEVRRSLVASMQELRRAVKRNDTIGMQRSLDRLSADDRALQGIREEERAELRSILTTEQQAKYVLFQVAFAKELRKKIGDIRKDRRGGSDSDNPW